MMKPSTLVTALCTTLFSGLLPMATAAQSPVAKQVSVLGRTWVVAPTETQPGYYQATRLNTELLPFRPPAVLSARQAARAFRSATGCSANLDSLYRSISGTYYSALICPEN